MPRTKPMINSQRFARQSPEGLRKRVIAAIPEWEKIPRKIRYALALLPVHGSFEAACKELSADFDSVPVGLKKSMKTIIKNWEDVGEYPTHSRTNKQGRTFTLALTNAEIMQQLANEMSVLAQVLLGGVTDDKGKALFTGADKSKILDMPMKPLQAIAEEILKLTGLDAAADDEGDESPNA